MAEEHDWHVFDVEHGYEVRRTDKHTYVVRQHGKEVAELTWEEFAKWRDPESPNPKGLR